MEVFQRQTRSYTSAWSTYAAHTAYSAARAAAYAAADSAAYAAASGYAAAFMKEKWKEINKLLAKYIAD